MQAFRRGEAALGADIIIFDLFKLNVGLRKPEIVLLLPELLARVVY